jgi:hypothetical protein
VLSAGTASSGFFVAIFPHQVDDSFNHRWREVSPKKEISSNQML